MSSDLGPSAYISYITVNVNNGEAVFSRQELASLSKSVTLGASLKSGQPLPNMLFEGRG